MIAPEKQPLVRTPAGRLTRHTEVLGRHDDGTVTVKVWWFRTCRAIPLSHADVMRIEAETAPPPEGETPHG